MPAGVDVVMYARVRYVNAVTSALRAAVAAHQQGVFYCDDVVCPLAATGTRALSLRADGFACPRAGCRGTLALDPARGFRELHAQLEYYEGAFNEARESSRRTKAAEAARVAAARGETVEPAALALPPPLPALLADLYATVAGEVSAYLARSAYNYIAPAIFSYVPAVNDRLGLTFALSGGAKAAAAKRRR